MSAGPVLRTLVLTCCVAALAACAAPEAIGPGVARDQVQNRWGEPRASYAVGEGQSTVETWFYERPYPPGVKNYNKTKPMRLEEFAAEKAWWGGVDRSNRVENEHAWKVSTADIKARNYNLDIKNPHSPDAVTHDPEELLADYAALQAKIGETRAKLSVLSAALNGKN